MSDRLDQLLEPGEREVHRWRGGWLPDAWPLLAVLLTPLVGFGVFLIALAPVGPALVYLASLVPGLLLVAFFARQSRATLSHCRSR